MSLRLYIRNAAGAMEEHTDRLLANTLDVSMFAEEGSTALSDIILDDEDGTLDIGGHRAVHIYETDAIGETRVYHGYTADRTVRRGPATIDDIIYGTEDSRIWQVSVADINSLLNRRLMLGSDANRKDENDVTRVLWVSNTNEGLHVDSTALVSTANGVAMGEDDYRNRFFNEVIDDCAQQSGKNYFLTHFSGVNTLWYDHAGSSAYSSTIRLSNAPADIDDITTLPYLAGETYLVRSPERVYSGVGLPYESGFVYEADWGTADAFAMGGRDVVMPAINVKTKARATARARRYLRDLDTEEDVIHCAFICDKTQVQLLREGMRVPFRAVHLPGYETEYIWVRVLRRSVRQVSAREYFVKVEMSASGDVAVAACLATADLTQRTPIAYTGSDAVFPSTPNCLVIGINNLRRTPSNNAPTPPSGMTLADWAYTSLGAGNNGTVGLSYKTTGGGNISLPGQGADYSVIGYEFSGVNEFQSAESISDQTSASPMVSPSITPMGDRVLLVAVFQKSFAGPAGGNTLPDIDIAAPAVHLDWAGTVAVSGPTDPTGQGPTIAVGYRFINNPSGSYTISATADTASFANGQWACVIACFGVDGALDIIDDDGSTDPPPTIPDDGAGASEGGTGGTLVPATPGALAAAIAAANNGDTLTLRGGGHVLSGGSGYGGIVTSKSLTIQNYTGEVPNITWDGSTRNNGLYFTGSGPVRLSGLVFTGSSAVTHDSNGSAQVELDGGSNLTIEDCTFIGHSAYDDHQQLVYQRLGTNITVRRTQFIANGTEGFGFHQYPGSPSNPNCLVDDCTFSDFGYSGGVTSDSRITVTNSVFTNNNIGVQVRDDGAGSIVGGNSGTGNTTPLDDQVSVTESPANTWS